MATAPDVQAFPAPLRRLCATTAGIANLCASRSILNRPRSLDLVASEHHQEEEPGYPEAGMVGPEPAPSTVSDQITADRSGPIMRARALAPPGPP